MNWEIILKTNKFMFIDNKIYYYRVNRKGSIMATKSSELLNNMNLFYNLKSLIYKNNDDKKHFDAALNFFIMNRFKRLAWEHKSAFKKSYYEFKKQYFNDKNIEVFHPNTIRKYINSYLFYFILKYDINIMPLSFCFMCYYKIMKFLGLDRKQIVPDLLNKN